MRRIAWLVAGLLLILAATCASLWRQYSAFERMPLSNETEVVLRVARGDSMGRVLAELESRGLTHRDWRWRLFNRLHPATIRAGEYAIAPGTLPSGLLEQLSAGRVIRYAFTIVEGWNFRRLRQALAADAILAASAPVPDSEDVMQGLDLPGMHPEGWFLPETYVFVRGDDAMAILRRAHEAMRDALDLAWSQRADVPLQSPYELLILASIVEKETARADERPLIAGVFARRLQQGWKLETDPTVIYGLGERFDGDIRSRDLRQDTPYNTYTRYGLPPTPIAMPSRDALLASARPAAGSAMFFVADGQGGHVFSDTLEAHNRAVRAMLGKKP